MSYDTCPLSRLTSLTMIPSRPTHIAANGIISGWHAHRQKRRWNSIDRGPTGHWKGGGGWIGSEEGGGLVGPPWEIRLSGKVVPEKREAVRKWLLLGPSRERQGPPGGPDSKESACNAEDTGDLGLIPKLGRPPGGGHGNPLQYSCLENPADRRAWWGHRESRLSNSTRERASFLCAGHSLRSTTPSPAYFSPVLCFILHTPGKGENIKIKKKNSSHQIFLGSSD